MTNTATAQTATTIRNTPVTRAAVEAAIKECDELGKAEFLKKHGYRDSAKYVLRHNGKSYPSKAIVGVAAGLAAKDFSGGKATIGRVLAKLGMKLGVLAFAFAASSILNTAHAAFEKQTGDAAIEARYYASGSTRVGHVLGFGAIGQSFMVTATEMSDAVEDAIYAVAATTDVEVAVDSGAFGRCVVNFPNSEGKLPRPDLSVGMHCPNPFTHAEWTEIFNLYNRLGAVLGSRLTVVAPDQVGFQKETLNLVWKYRNEIRSLLDLGVKVMVVSQKGALDQAKFDEAIERILGRSDYIRALPCKKNATTLAELKAFVAARKPAQLHCLGMGLRNANAPRVALAVAKLSPETKLTFDSCLLAESVGKDNGRSNHPAERKGGPRIFTAAKEKARKLFGFGAQSRDPQYHVEAIKLAWGAA